MKKFFSKEVRIALFVIAGIFILFVGMNFLKGIIVFSDDNTYKVSMDNLAGLSVSSPVFADGYQVGVVRSIDYDYESTGRGTMISIDVDKQMRIPAGSTAEVESDIMGNVKLNILLANNPRQRIEPGGVIKGNLAKGMLGELAVMMPTIKAMVPKLDSILTSVNALLADPALAAILHNAEATTANLKTTSADLNRLMAELDRKVPGILAKADNTLANTETLTANLAQIDVEGTMASVNATLKNCRELTDKLNSSEGTIGKFLNDASLYNNLDATMRDADSLMIDFKARPSRYIHFSVFGKKDKK